MRRMVLVAVALVLLPFPGFSQTVSDLPPCSQAGPGAVGALDNRTVAALETEMRQGSHGVIVCVESPLTESPGHGIFGLVDWDRRQIASVRLHPLGGTAYFVTEVMVFTALKPPLGAWRVEESSPTDLYGEIRGGELENTLAGISRGLDANPEDVRILWVPDDGR